MSGWEIACVIIGMLVTVEADHIWDRITGAVLILLPLFFNFWRVG